MENTPQGTAILTSSRNLAWYAERPYISLSKIRDVGATELAGAARRTDASVIVYTKRHTTYTHPQLEFLLDPQDRRVPESFRLLYQVEGKWPVTAYWIGD